MRRKPLFPPPKDPTTGKTKHNKGRQDFTVLTINGRVRLWRRRWIGCWHRDRLRRFGFYRRRLLLLRRLRRLVTTATAAATRSWLFEEDEIGEQVRQRRLNLLIGTKPDCQEQHEPEHQPRGPGTAEYRAEIGLRLGEKETQLGWPRRDAARRLTTGNGRRRNGFGVLVLHNATAGLTVFYHEL